jgi:hypothetical protein
MKQMLHLRKKGLKRAVLLILLAVLHCNNTALYDEALTRYYRVVRPGLNEWYPLNGDLASRIGGAAGSATGAYTAGTNRTGEAGKSVCVSSVRADFGSTNFGSIPFTISMWVKLNSLPASINRFFRMVMRRRFTLDLGFVKLDCLGLKLPTGVVAAAAPHRSLM